LTRAPNPHSIFIVIFVANKNSVKPADPVSASVAVLVFARLLSLWGMQTYQDATVKITADKTLDFIGF
jgi:hypothetical protein